MLDNPEYVPRASLPRCTRNKDWLRHIPRETSFICADGDSFGPYALVLAPCIGSHSFHRVQSQQTVTDVSMHSLIFIHTLYCWTESQFLMLEGYRAVQNNPWKTHRTRGTWWHAGEKKGMKWKIKDLVFAMVWHWSGSLLTLHWWCSVDSSWCWFNLPSILQRSSKSV